MNFFFFNFLKKIEIFCLQFFFYFKQFYRKFIYFDNTWCLLEILEQFGRIEKFIRSVNISMTLILSHLMYSAWPMIDNRAHKWVIEPASRAARFPLESWVWRCESDNTIELVDRANFASFTAWIKQPIIRRVAGDKSVILLARSFLIMGHRLRQAHWLGEFSSNLIVEFFLFLQYKNPCRFSNLSIFFLLLYDFFLFKKKIGSLTLWKFNQSNWWRGDHREIFERKKNENTPISPFSMLVIQKWKDSKEIIWIQ